jgi:hypothetical protein
MTKRHTLEVKYDSNTGDHYLEFSPDMLAQVGWDFGDTIVWEDNNNGSWTLSKKVDNEASIKKEDGSIDGANQKSIGGDS